MFYAQSTGAVISGRPKEEEEEEKDEEEEEEKEEEKALSTRSPEMNAVSEIL